jgi:hypothetical protein
MVSERKRQQALAGSKVKIEGRDLVASGKVATRAGRYRMPQFKGL